MVSLARAIQEADEARAVLKKARAAHKRIRAQLKAIRKAELKLAKEMRIARKLERREAYHERRARKKEIQQESNPELLMSIAKDTKKNTKRLLTLMDEGKKNSQKLSSFGESLDRLERTQSQMTFENVQQSPAPVRTLVANTPPGITKPKPRLSPLVAEVMTHPIFRKRAKASKNW